MALNIIETSIPHVFRIDLQGNGLADECAIVQRDNFGNILYLKIADLDQIDRERIGKILKHRFVKSLPLWDIMSQTTLKNNVNALDYFHQLVKGITKEGKPYVPRAGSSGYSINQTMEIARQQQEKVDVKAVEDAAAAELAAAEAVVSKAKDGRGRPKKTS